MTKIQEAIDALKRIRETVCWPESWKAITEAIEALEKAKK
jgi:hypothetical protein